MIKFFKIILIALSTTTVYSQNTSSVLKNDIGINVNSILNKVIINKINDDITNPFPDQLSVLTFRHHVSPKVAIRIGLGFDHFSRNDSTLSTFSGILIEQDEYQFHAIHFGIQKNIFDVKKVKLSLGWDWFIRREVQEKTRNDFFIGGGINFQEVISNEIYKENSLGFGVPIGIQYFFNDHILISTEFSLELFKTFSKSKTELNEESNNEYRKNPEVVNLKFRAPLSLFVHYRF